ncbi:hypothetical protein [Flavobacterium sp. GCM10027622]|uniref:hypothetical protein n=1 Tax=unclassified Flavobacterium TaxID=196869 RepID=UPI003613B9B2
MNLKTLISLKFIATIIIIPSLMFITGNIKSAYRTLERQNEILLEQKKYYELIIKLEPKDAEGRKNLNDILTISNRQLEKEMKELPISFNLSLWILIIALIITANVFGYFNPKIEKLKNQESEEKKKQLL